MGVFPTLVVDLSKISAHILTLSTLSIVSVMIEMMCFKERTILLAKLIVFCVFSITLDMHVKIKLFKSYCSGVYGSELW